MITESDCITNVLNSLTEEVGVKVNMNGDCETKSKRIYINTAVYWMTLFPVGVQANNSKTTRHLCVLELDT